MPKRREFLSIGSISAVTVLSGCISPLEKDKELPTEQFGGFQKTHSGRRPRFD